MRNWPTAVLFGFVLLGGLGGWVWQRQQAAALRQFIRHANIEVQAENARLRRIVRSGSEAAAGDQLREQIERTRQHVAVLERDIQKPVTGVGHDVQFTENRDPEKGPVRVEYFRSVGRATPSAAFQTAIWAVSTGVETEWASLFAVSPTGREKLQAIIARMAPAMQERYNPPEKVLGLLLAYDVLDEEGYEIGETGKPNASGQVQLTVLRVKDGRAKKLEKKIPFVPGPGGWQLPITDKMIDAIPGYLESASMYVPPRGAR